MKAKAVRELSALDLYHDWLFTLAETSKIRRRLTRRITNSKP
jgi:hypothetical protein